MDTTKHIITLNSQLSTLNSQLSIFKVYTSLSHRHKYRYQ